MRAFLGAWLAKACGDDHQIRVVQRLETAQALLVVRIDVFPFLVPREDHRAMKAMVLAEDLAQHGQSFFRTILFVAGHQNDAFAFARSLLAVEDESFRTLSDEVDEQSGKNEDE